ncbi:hypothetical protein I6A84_36550 [Frankia sp. CNm7]|uniref:Uncharacterized protein n=1 Tax=Frankia nepalensis TaxID=1836974 RepID=A0A937RE17_9ACTN|nr:hypothetical protein [Frankia nepalensis]MBL7501410.1 hypothetical protein [Frankia nepalensis]MBL7511937.1 hypothetical protein [Frankia nepalensis]MBL7523422.1 hypothetical protein [Frankia nepalensis]MBL7628242.1 hypothetical protein [Frankia nepalensis]
MTDTRIRVALHAGLVAVFALAAGLAAMDVTGPVRLVATLVAVVLLPGAAILTRLRTADLAVWFGLAMALSLAVAIVASLLMVWTRQWYPVASGLALGTLSALVLLDDIRRALARTPGAEHG